MGNSPCISPLAELIGRAQTVWQWATDLAAAGPKSVDIDSNLSKGCGMFAGFLSTKSDGDAERTTRNTSHGA